MSKFMEASVQPQDTCSVQKHQRLDYLDSAAGIAILWVIFLCHTAETCGWKNPVEHATLYTFSFAMPWFFFKAGMMFLLKSNKAVIVGSARRLLVPFIIWSMIGWCVKTGGEVVGGSFSLTESLQLMGHTLIHNGAINGNVSLWFLMTLFFVRVIYNALVSCHVPEWGIAIVFGVAAWLLCRFNIHDPYILGNLSNGLFFYAMGSIMRNIQHRNSVFMLSLLIVCLSLIFTPGLLVFYTNSFWYSPAPPYLSIELYYLAAIIVVNNFFCRFAARHIPLLTHVGRRSMVYYVEHYIVLVATVQLLDRLGLFMESSLRFLVVSVVIILSMLVSDWLFSFRPLRWMVGEN